eukprot:scaffold145656_cov32-Tisochrysis_lutea.AAC.1
MESSTVRGFVLRRRQLRRVTRGAIHAPVYNRPQVGDHARPTNATSVRRGTWESFQRFASGRFLAPERAGKGDEAWRFAGEVIVEIERVEGEAIVARRTYYFYK